MARKQLLAGDSCARDRAIPKNLIDLAFNKGILTKDDRRYTMRKLLERFTV